MIHEEIYKAAKVWIEAALTEVGDRVYQAKPRELPRGRPAANVPQRKTEPWITMELTVDSSRGGTPYTRTTDQHTGAPAVPPDPAENLYRHEIHRRRFVTLHLEIGGAEAMLLAARLIDSRQIPAIKRALRAAGVWPHPLTDPVDISENTGTAWQIRAAMDFRIHYLLTTVTDAPIIETAGITMKTWQPGSDQEVDPPDHEETFTVPD